MLKPERVLPEEREILYQMAQRYWAEIMPNAPVVKEESLRPAYFAEEFPERGRQVEQWWAVLDGTRIGFANLEFNEALEGEWVYIRDLYIEPAYRRHGLGRTFVQALIEGAKSRGIYRVDLHSRADNPGAKAFWERVGFSLASYRWRQYL